MSDRPDIRTLTPEGAESALSKIAKWSEIAKMCDAAGLERMLDAQLNVMVIFEHEFETRFPEQHAAWAEKHGA